MAGLMIPPGLRVGARELVVALLVGLVGGCGAGLVSASTVLVAIRGEVRALERQGGDFAAATRQLEERLDRGSQERAALRAEVSALSASTAALATRIGELSLELRETRRERNGASRAAPRLPDGEVGG